MACERGALTLATVLIARLEYYYSLQTWPEPIKGHLKLAIKLRNRGDYERSEAYFRE
jgi:hypothetical protein